MSWFVSFAGYMMAAVVALLPIVNPLGAVPLVMSVTAHLSADERLRQVRLACIYALVMMLSFLVAGGLIMNFFGISIPGMRIAGGMIVAFLGFGMLFPHPPSARPSDPDRRDFKDEVAFTPLAMPGLSGPGTFAVIMSLSAQASSRPGLERILDFAGVACGILLVAMSCWFVLRGAERFNRLLGATGMVALTRLMGFLMICIGVQFIINGFSTLLADPTVWSGLAEALGRGGD